MWCPLGLFRWCQLYCCWNIWTLQKLYLAVLLRFFPFASNLCAVSIFMKLRGLPVSANQNICWLFVIILIQNSPLFVLFTSDTFSSWSSLMWWSFYFTSPPSFLLYNMSILGRLFCLFWSVLPSLFPHLCFLSFCCVCLCASWLYLCGGCTLVFVCCWRCCGLNVGRGGISDLHSFGNGRSFLHILQASFFAGHMFKWAGKNLFPHLLQFFICPVCGVGSIGPLFCLLMYCIFSNHGLSVWMCECEDCELCLFCWSAWPFSLASAYFSVSLGVLSLDIKRIWICWFLIPCINILLASFLRDIPSCIVLRASLFLSGILREILLLFVDIWKTGTCRMFNFLLVWMILLIVQRVRLWCIFVDTCVGIAGKIYL